MYTIAIEGYGKMTFGKESLKSMNKERWNDIKGFEGLYQVSNMGRVKSFNRIVYSSQGRKYLKKGRIFKQQKNNNYYRVVALRKDRKSCARTIHSLVLETFVGDCPYGYEAMHLDNDRTNNKLSNLKWGTISENQLQRHKDKTANGKLKPREVMLIKKLIKNKIKTILLSKMFKVSKSAIKDIKKGRWWKWVLAYE